jgi:hypothetical protein
MGYRENAKKGQAIENAKSEAEKSRMKKEM